LVVSRCIEAVEKFGGLKMQGVYRTSGASSQIQKLRGSFDKGEYFYFSSSAFSLPFTIRNSSCFQDATKVNLDDFSQDIPVLTGTLKLYFRELPDSLLPKSMYHTFIDAAKIEDERLRLISIHELINQLHDSHYSTLQALMHHLWRYENKCLQPTIGHDRGSVTYIFMPYFGDFFTLYFRHSVQLLESENRMGIQNLAIVWGPTILDSPDSNPDPTDLKLRSRVIETILSNFEKIFETEG
jgi:hypothetical protein